MNRKLDILPRNRAIKVLKALIEYPFHYTIRELASQNDVSNDPIRDDIEAIKNAGFETTIDKNHRYAIINSKPLESIKEILFLTEVEHQLIRDALDRGGVKLDVSNKIKRKLESIYDYTKFGSHTVSKVYLNKLNLLEKAKTDKQKVKLINYKSTSSQITKDRVVEVFHILHKDDMVQAFDLEHKEIRFFRISRFDRIEQLDDDWENEGKHRVVYADIFGIVEKNTKAIHLRINIAALNALLDRYPMAKSSISPSADQANEFVLECKVNADFKGLINYILGNYDNIIEIVEPQELTDQLNKKLETMKF
jgi:predicted DNA-binding transcriptional regulator YafY